MQKFTKTEIQWILDALTRESVRHEKLKDEATVNGAFHHLRMEQLESICERLCKVLDEKSKRIEVKY